MMSGQGKNQIFLNKKSKNWRSRTLANPISPPPYVQEHLIFALIPHPPTPLKVEVI